MQTTPRRLLVTGPPGVGKSTLVCKVLENLKTLHPNIRLKGFYTRPDSRNSSWPSVGKYKVDVAGFEALALPELQVNGDCDLFLVDEVGKMELLSSAFFPAVWEAFNSDALVVATIPVPRYGRDIAQVAKLRSRSDVAVYTLNKQNRDNIASDISSLPQLFLSHAMNKNHQNASVRLFKKKLHTNACGYENI